jgi:hypothetical protein
MSKPSTVLFITTVEEGMPIKAKAWPIINFKRASSDKLTVLAGSHFF